MAFQGVYLSLLQEGGHCFKVERNLFKACYCHFSGRCYQAELSAENQLNSIYNTSPPTPLWFWSATSESLGMGRAFAPSSFCLAALQ